MGTQSKGWQEEIAPVAAKFRLSGGMFGVNVGLKVNANAVAMLMADMAQKLDLSKDIIIRQEEQIRILERQVSILSEDVTMEGNNV